MAGAVKFPPSTEVKRMIAAVKKAGLEIGSVDIRADGVTIYPPSKSEAGMTAYEKWKAADNARLARN